MLPSSPASRLRNLLSIALLFLAASLTTGCASFYVDTGLADLKPEEIKKTERAQPVQLLFEFQTKGSLNAGATEYLKNQVTDIAKASGMFSDVSTIPASNGSTLAITLNNVPVTDDAFAKGFVTGFTFGLAGNTVTDGYICTINYIPSNGAPKLTKTLRHAIHTTVGAESAPKNAKKSENMEDAVRTMTRQVVANALNELRNDSAFGQ